MERIALPAMAIFEPMFRALNEASARYVVTRRCHLSVTLSITPAERLAWLEELIDFAYRAGALPRREQGPRP